MRRAAACRRRARHRPRRRPRPSGRADIGGYELAYECQGEGEPTVILEAGLGAAGTSEFFGFIDQVGGEHAGLHLRPCGDGQRATIGRPAST